MTFRLLQPGALWPALVARSAHALACGALCPIETIQTTLDDAGVRFVVRQVSSLVRKASQKERSTGSSSDPFLPHDPDLFVADLSRTHFALLNKFNVIDRHLLIVTRAFEPQEALLDLDDFQAWFACLNAFDGLGFYNGGRDAGASQPHKHLQIVPLPLGDAGRALPIDVLIDAAAPEPAIGRLPGLPFDHAFTRLVPGSVSDMADQALERYRTLLRSVGLGAVNVGGRDHQSGPYNLLVTPKWMLLVPRSTEQVEGIAVNSLGFAGSLFVRNAQEMAAIRAIGPMTLLSRVGLPRPDAA
jgi:ATP adenylyltransferase